ncbi:hypothetical protein [Sediminimonas sp.]|uniref:hypothetical protein n=1 Tax=Sediminimonas sp. TaxID=2823379 RepID=UPI0025F398D2|nr:hypothetical protein [Sediminimonas sp.]
MSKIDPTLAHQAPVEKTEHPDETGQDRKSENRRDAMIILATVAGLALWGGAVALWGIPGLYIPALALVPVIWILLLMVTRG